MVTGDDQVLAAVLAFTAIAWLFAALISRKQ